MKGLLPLAAAVVGSAAGLTSRCDDLPWASERSHTPVGEKNGTYTAQTGYSWHIHYLHYTRHEEALVEAFQRDFCEAFAKFGEGGAVQPSPWGPNDIAPGGEYVVGTCDPSELALRSNGHRCGNGTCPTTPTKNIGPWSCCQNEFFVPATRIDAVTAWLHDYDLKIPVMRHPNSGCQWGDHAAAIRAEFFGPARVPEMCLWELPCNDPGFGCRDGMCGAIDNADTRERQHASGCVAEVTDG